MGISLKAEHLKRYKDIAWLLMKYGRGELVKSAGLEEAIEGEDDAHEPPAEARELAADLERMGPTYIKLAQLLSTRADILPPAYLEALARLQDNVEPFSFGVVEEIICTELGVRLSKAFAQFESQPVAAASLGQVHRAVMHDGRQVVVKVQRPGIREQIADDISALGEISSFLDTHTVAGKRYEFSVMLEEFRKTLLRELDYRQEARNLSLFADNLREFERIVIPTPIEDYTTSRVLTMDYIKGRKVTSLSPLGRLDIDGYLLAEHLFHAYLHQILVDGLFHADPHPGNVFLTDEGSIALIDLGMVARLTTQFQDSLLQLLLAISEGRGDEAARLAIKLGEPKDNFDETNFRRQIAELVVEHHAVKLDNINAGRAVLEITRMAGEANFRLPPEFTMFAKTLLNLDQVVHTLDPKFDPNFAIRTYANTIMQERVRRTLSSGNIYTTFLELKQLAEKLPGRVNQLLDAVAQNGIEVKVDAIDEAKLMEGFQKIANRITLGLVLAALIIGAALMMRVETTFKILGYPAIAIIFFLVAAGGALMLAFNILFKDEKRDN
ncbi:MAG: AarF/UbiB family protein [Pyrinomonadaceae bacterium]